MIEKYIDIINANENANKIKITFDYDIGGYDMFTYTQKPRGYYIRVTPVLLENRGSYNVVSFTAFTGFKKCIKTVTRKSAKAEREALETARDFLPDIVAAVCKHNGVSVNPEDITI
jgi:hypothetical protein